jgi:urease accessory protein
MVQNITDNQTDNRTATPWQGQLQLAFSPTDGITHLVSSQATAPLKVQRSFPQADGTCQVVMLHTAGGLVGGDRLQTHVTIAPQSQVLLTTAAAAKIYRSNGLTAKQAIEIQVGAEAQLEWLPQETIVFDQSQFQQDLRINLAPGAQALLWEITRFGRTARGEIVTSGDWRSLTEVWQGDRPLWIDRQWLPASAQNWQHPYGLGGQPIVGTFAWIGIPVEPEFGAQARSFWRGDPQSIGVTQMPQGLIARYRGNSSHDVRQWFIQIWQSIREQQWQRSIELPRVWML